MKTQEISFLTILWVSEAVCWVQTGVASLCGHPGQIARLAQDGLV